MLPNILLAAGGAVGFIIFTALVRSGHFLRCLLYSAITGNVTLVVVAWLGSFTGALLTVNLFTVAVSSLLGIPGVLAMVLLKLIFAI